MLNRAAGAATQTPSLGRLRPLIRPRQSPAPNGYYEDIEPPANGKPSGSRAAVDYGLNLDENSTGYCSTDSAYSLSELETHTVYDINHSIEVASEITPQFLCDTSLTTWEDQANALIVYVFTNASSTSQIEKYWLGIMVDEEDGCGFMYGAYDAIHECFHPDGSHYPVPNPQESSYQLMQAFNAEVTGKFSYEEGVDWSGSQPWLFSDIAVGAGDFTQAEYNSVVSQTDPAPQIYTSAMASYASTSYTDGTISSNLITCEPDPSIAPWDTISYDQSHVSGPAWEDLVSLEPTYSFFTYFSDSC